MSIVERTAASTFDRVAVDLAHAPFSALAAAIKARIDRVLEHWRDLSLKAMPHLDALTLKEFEDTIAEILSAAAAALKSADPGQLLGVIQSGPQHGIDRFIQQYSLLDLFEEVRILRGVVIVETAEEMERPLQPDEAATFHAIFDIIIQQGVIALTQMQNELLQQTTATTREMNERLLVSSVREQELAEQAQQAKAQMSESEERFRTLADNMAQLAWMADAKGEVYWYNQRWYDYTGVTLEEMQGWGWRKLHHPHHVARVVERLQHSWDTGEEWEDTFPLRGKDGQYRWFLSRSRAIRDDEGRVLRWFGTNTDITEQREMQNKIVEQTEQLAREARNKDEFLATLAHELRNPLAPIRNAVQFLDLAGTGGPEATTAKEVIARQVSVMVRLVDDLLDVSRISRNMLDLRKQRVKLAGILENAVESSHPLIDQCGHELTVDLPLQPIELDADPIRLAQVFLNLLNNAAKYTRRGGRIWLAAWRDGNDAVVSVRDNGTGISGDMLARIFDMFTQVDRSLDESRGGLGIGLTLARRLVEMHDGSIEAHSQGVDQGSEFIVRLPLSVQPQHAPHPTGGAPRAQALRGCRVLVVDDNKDSANSLAMLLRRKENDIQVAYDGLEAVKAAEEFRPELVLLDIGLPKLNGYEVARRIRQQPWGQDIILVALTGWGQDEDRRRSHDAGFDLHFVKPVELAALENLLAGR